MTSDRARYHALIDATLRAALPAVAAAASKPEPRDGEVAVACALPSVAERLGVTLASSERARLQSQLAAATLATRCVDGFGHSRPMYRPMLIRAAMRGERSLAHSYLAAVAPRLEAFAFDTGPLHASHGSETIDAVFGAWAIDALAAEVAAPVMHRLVRQQQPDGTFLARTASDNPEPRWYDELALLHALSTFRARDEAIDAAVARAVAFHAAETQPDHASSHPWAIGAFLTIDEGVPLADMMLHAAGVQQPSAMDAVSLLLLADALEPDCTSPSAGR